MLALCLSLVAVFGAATLFLGHLIDRDRQANIAHLEQVQRVEKIYAVERALHEFRHSNSQIATAMLLGDGAAESKARLAVADARRRLDATLARLAQADPSTVAVFRSQFSDVPALLENARDALLAGQRDRAARPGGAAQERLDMIESALADASAREHAQMDAMQLGETDRLRSSLRIAAGVIVVAGLTGLVLSLIVVRSILRPLRATIAALSRINAGELNVELPPPTQDEFGAVSRALAQFREQSERLRRLAYIDPLTGLGNRARLEELLAPALERARKSTDTLALFYIDLDNFRSVNDRFGHRAGDQFLREAAARLHRFMPPKATLCRYSGDKFTILVPQLRSGPDIAPESLAREQAEILGRGIGEPFSIGDDLVNMSASIGVALFPGDGDTVDQLISAADAAVLAAKQQGRNLVCFAASQPIGTLRRQIAVASDIRRGIELNEFEPFYQPVIDVERGRVVGAEALLRWRHPDNGLVPPSDFVHVAEESGLVSQLGELCLRKAYDQALAWNARGLKLRIAVNLSVRQVHDGRILQILRSLPKPPPGASQPIEFELTESAMLDTTDYAYQVLVEIKRLGFRIGLDDFGTGYSSFSYLQRLPIDKIKIDRQFVTTMGSSKQALAIVSATLTLAQNLDLSVVAEGVENSDQMRQLKLLGCKLHQGFHFTRALPATEFEAWMSAFERQGLDAMIAAAHREPPMTIPVL